MRAAPLPVAAFLAAALVLTACAAAPDGEIPAPAPTTIGPGPTPSTTADPPPLPDPPPTEEPRPELPAELAARMPPEEEIDAMVLDAEAAYRAHRAAYDAAARTGFSDPPLVEKLMATAAGDASDVLRLEAVSVAESGRVVDGGAEIVGAELYSLVVPEEEGAGLGVVFDVCLLLEGALKESDGTVVLELGGEPLYVRVRLVDRTGTWLLVTQRVQDAPCPEQLRRP